MQICYENKQINNTYNTKLLRLITDISLSWKFHMGELTSKLNKACCVIRSVKLFTSLGVLRIIYFSDVHSVISFGIIWWGGIFHCKIIFKIQKRIIRVIMGSSSTDSCSGLFTNLEVFLSNLSIYFLYYCLLLRIENCLDLTPMYMTLIQDIILTYIYP